MVIRDLLKNKNGTTALEFAIITPVLLVFIFGIICFGIYLGAVHGVQQLAAEAARASIAGIDDAERRTLAQSVVDNDAGAYPFLSASGMVVQSTNTGPNSQSFTITLRYDASDLPIFGLPYIPLPSKTIVRSATVHRGGL